MATRPQPQVSNIPVSLGGTGYLADGGVYWYNNTGHSTTVSAANSSSWPFAQSSYGPILNGQTQYASFKAGATKGTYDYSYTDQITDGQGHIIIQ